MQNFNVWIVDDNPDDIERILRICKKIEKQPEFKTFEDAYTLYEGIQNTTERPDLLLLDYDMPGDNGDKVLEKLKELGEESFPVVMMTGRLVDTTHTECYKLGARGFVFKSFDYDIFKKDVLSLFTFWHSTREI
ncbi:MAG: response regulator [Alphaproteobacteria bacterium]|nr:response regulator [Alphaproteobacteria bacterium]